MRRPGKSMLILASCLVFASSIAVSAAVTYAGYIATSKATQGGGYQGKVKTSIYLNANIWSTADPVYFLYVFGGTGDPQWISNSKVITPTIGSTAFTLYVFEFPDWEYTGFNIVRCNPDAEHPNSWDAKWNQTNDITYRSAVNYYCIENWHSATGGTDNSGYSTQHLSPSGDTLVFDGSVGWND